MSSMSSMICACWLLASLVCCVSGYLLTYCLVCQMLLKIAKSASFIGTSCSCSISKSVLLNCLKFHCALNSSMCLCMSLCVSVCLCLSVCVLRSVVNYSLSFCTFVNVVREFVVADWFVCKTSLTASICIIIIVRLHRCSTYVDATHCYRLSSVVCLSVCLSVCHTSEPCKNGWTDQNDGIWVEDLGGLRNRVLDR